MIVDYIGCPWDCAAVSDSYFTCSEFVMPHEHEDHHPVICNLYIPLLARDAKYKQRVAVYIRRTTMGPVRVVEFNRLLGLVPPVTSQWN